FLFAASVGFAEPASSPSTQPATTRTADDLPPPMRVTLHLKDVPAKQALADLLAQVKLPPSLLHSYLDADLRDIRITADFVDQPFLVALKDLCRQCYLEPYDTYVPGKRIEFMRRAPNKARRSPATTRAAPSWMPPDVAAVRATTNLPL